MRYLGEGHEVQVTVPKNVGQSEMVQFAWKEFHNVHDLPDFITKANKMLK